MRWYFPPQINLLIPNGFIRGFVNYLLFYDHNLPASNARRPIKNSKDANFLLAYFKRDKQIDPWSFFSGLDDIIQKSLGPYLLMTSSQIKFKPQNVRMFSKSKLGEFLLFTRGWTRAVASGGPVVPGHPIWNRRPHISRLVPRMLHESNTVFFESGLPSGFWPPLLLNPGDGPALNSSLALLNDKLLLNKVWATIVVLRS